MNIIFVCSGNTCRSPMAQGYLADKKIPFLSVISRGIFALRESVSENSEAVMREIGIDISSHISAPLTSEDIKWADKIICLDKTHFNLLIGAGLPSSLLSVLGAGIPDPYGCSLDEYRACRDNIISQLDRLICENFFENFEVLPIADGHICAVAQLEKECFSEPWSESAIAESIEHSTKFFVAQMGDDVLGYIGFSAVCGEAYVTNVAVFPKYRNKGVATALIKKAFSYCENENIEFLSLEVRKSNQNAISLYEKLGFECVGERKDFYRNPKENAYIMTKYF